MKKLRSIRRYGISAIAMLLCLALIATCLVFTVPTVRPLAEANVGSGVSMLDGKKVTDSCDYGDEFEVPVSVAGTQVEVIAPDGTKATVKDNKVVAEQIGNYKIVYKTTAGVEYAYYVKVRLDKEYFLKVKYNGADIPSYIAIGEEFTLPRADVVYYDDNNILQPYPDNDYEVTVSDSLGNDYEVNSAGTTTNVFKAEKNGKVFITYTATVADGSKRFTKVFTVNVQSTAPSGGNPTIAISGVQKDVSVNRAVTLPKAEATDANDDNVKVVVTVTDKDGDVLGVDIDDDGYAYQDPAKLAAGEYKPVEFDNDKAMTFYPTHTGQYKVTYTAYNDSYKEGGNIGKSSTREYYITVSDLVAPVFKSVREDSIPETWGMEVKKAGVKDGEEVVAEELGGKIKFYVPEVVDNKDHAYAKDADDTDLISVYFRITDADKNNKVIVEFQNILADDDKADSQFAANDVYTEKAVFSTENGFEFDFDKYARKDGDKAAAKPGTYTVLYRARDKANNTSSKSYTITLQDSYTDKYAPTTADVNALEYISTEDKTFTVPYPDYADAADTRPTVDYRLYSDGDEYSKYIEVKGGEEAEFKKIGDIMYLIVDGDEDGKLMVGSNLYYYVGVTDKVGNFKSNMKDNADIASVTSAAGLKNITESTAVITEKAYAFSFDGSGLEFTNASVKKDASDPIVAGDLVDAGSFTVATTADMRYYTGFEVSVLDPKNNVLDVTLETLSSVDGEEAKIYVQNIRFTASSAAEKAGEAYKVVVRVFDVNGYESLYGYTLTGVKASKNNNNTTSAVTTIGANGNINVKYKLNNDVIKGFPGNEDDGEDAVYRVVRKFEAPGAFAVMGNEITAKNAGEYTVQDGYIASKWIDGATFDSSKVEHVGANEGVYSFTITDEASPVLELMSDMPTYWEKYDPTNAETIEKTTVKLPKAVGYTENGNATISVNVKDPELRDVAFDKDTYTFKGTKDGTYKITYTATYANSKSENAEYFMNIGDVEAPSFTFKAGTGTQANATMKVGDKFKFAEIVLDHEADEQDNASITKKLINPSFEEVSGATVSGTYKSNKAKENNGSAITLSNAGTYKVEYTVKDAAGNEYVRSYNITVVSSGSSAPTTWTTLSIVLILVAVVLLFGVIIYVIRFRKVKR